MLIILCIGVCGSLLFLSIRTYEQHIVRTKLNSFDPNKKTIALTFDDGPVPITKEIVDMLNNIGVKATFFVLGDEAERRPETLQYAIHHGHSVQNHSFDHPRLLGFRTKSFINDQLTQTNVILKKYTQTAPLYFRTPFGESSPWLRYILAQHTLTEVDWTLSPQDWNKNTSAEELLHTFKSITKSEVLLLHDRVYADPTKMEVLKIGIQDLKQRGFTFVTIPALYR